MKALLITLILAGSFAQAADLPLITKSSGGGLSPIEWVRNEQCEVFADRAVITKTYGGGQNRVQLKEERKIAITGGVHDLINKALAEKVEEKQSGLCDAPSTHISFDNGKVLFSSGGCGSPRRDRSGPNAEALKSIVNAYCPLTYDHGANP